MAELHFKLNPQGGATIVEDDDVDTIRVFDVRPNDKGGLELVPDLQDPADASEGYNFKMVDGKMTLVYDNDDPTDNGDPVTPPVDDDDDDEDDPVVPPADDDADDDADEGDDEDPADDEGDDEDPADDDGE